MKRILIIAASALLLLLAAIVAWVIFSPIPPRGQASVVLLSVTNDASGQRFATLLFTNPSPSAVVGIAHSVDYKTAVGWSREQPVPGILAADLASAADLGPGESHIVTVRFPTKTGWRLRLRYHEQPRAVEGAIAGVTDLLARLRDRAKHVSYTGQSYLAETSEIVY